jgi:hypothetical protein
MPGYLAAKQKYGYLSELGHSTTSTKSYFPGQTSANGGNIVSITSASDSGAGTITASGAAWVTNQWASAIIEVWNVTKTTFRARYTIASNNGTVLTLSSDTPSSDGVVNTDVGEIIAYAKTPANSLTFYPTGLYYTDEFNPVETEVEVHKYRKLTSTSREASAMFQGRKIVKGKMEGHVSQWRMLKYCIGKDTWTANTTPNRETHVITYNDELPSTLFALHQDGTGSTTDFDRYASGMKVDKWDASFDMGGQWKLSIDWLGSKEEKTTNTITWTADDVYEPMFSWDTSLTYLSQAYARVESCRLGGVNNLTPKWYGNTTRARYCYVIDEGDADYDFEFKLAISDTTLFDEMIAFTTSSGLSTKDITIVSTRTVSTDLITFTLEDVQIIGNPIPIQSKGKLTVTVKGTAAKIYATFENPDGVMAHET